MIYINSINLIGNLTRDPELRVIPNSGKSVTTFSIAVRRPFSSDKTDFFKVVVFDKQAESCATYLFKGSKAGVTGHIAINKYEGKDGTEKTSVEVISSQVEFLTPKGDKPNEFQDMKPIQDSDIPF